MHWTRPAAASGRSSGADLTLALGDAGIELRNPDQAFIEAVRAGAPATPDFATALRAHVVTDALYRSAAAGGAMVEIPAAVRRPIRV